MNEEKIKRIVKERYAKAAKKESTCCCPASSSCCAKDEVYNLSQKIGYSQQELDSIPQGANLGLGCGNPVALASLREGETVLDLGSGAGFDCFLAVQKVGPKGKVIGVDMTTEMVEKANENARQGNYGNVEFRLGEIEDLPVQDNSVDVVISNCVINLSPDKTRVFQEAFRVLKPGGRIMVSDIVLLRELPDTVKNSIEAYVGCLAGAQLKDDYLSEMEAAGFHNIRVVGETGVSPELVGVDPVGDALCEAFRLSPEEAKDLINSVVSIKVSGIKT